MGLDNFTTQKRTGAGIPTTNGRPAGGRLSGLPRGRQIHKTFNNIKITILCGFVTILVLRGTIGIRSDGTEAGYWAKLPLIRRLMLSHPEVEWIWWMDSDALFTDMVFEIPLSKYDNYNLVVHGYPDLMFNQKSWIALNTGSFLFRNCQWSLDLLDAWAPMGPKGPIRDEAGKILTANLKGRPAFEADDQSALIYLLISKKDEWMDKMIEKYHPGLGDERWPFVTHFVGCKPCGSYGDYPVERCLRSMERAFNFADNQVLKLYGFRHRGLLSPKIKRIRNETATPLEFNDLIMFT
ncbi:unnamed protein product, partial [Vitis vinifera]